jgi:hypothetical protein
LIALPVNILLVCCSARFTRALRRNAGFSRWLLGLRLAVEKTWQPV